MVSCQRVFWASLDPEGQKLSYGGIVRRFLGANVENAPFFETKSIWTRAPIITRAILSALIYPGNISARKFRGTEEDNEVKSELYTCFDGHRMLATGSLSEVALVVKRMLESGSIEPVLIFDDATGRSVDINTRGSDEEVVARLGVASASPRSALPEESRGTREAGFASDSEPRVDERRGRGRPKLGVVAREVTLLPRHWEWLSTQPGGASVALRKLVEEARRANADKDRSREAKERTYHFMSAIAGDLPGYEEAIRALFGDDRTKFTDMIENWPTDVRDHATRLAYGHQDLKTSSSQE